MMIPDEMTVEFDVLISTGDDGVLNHLDASSVVLKHFGWLALRSSQFAQNIPQPKYVFVSDSCRSVLRLGGRKGLALLHDCVPAD